MNELIKSLNINNFCLDPTRKKFKSFEMAADVKTRVKKNSILDEINKLTINKLMTQLPMIDIGPYVRSDGTEQDKRRSSEQLHVACRDAGFFYVTGHGVSEATLASIRALAQSIFSGLGFKEKERISIKNLDYARGYQQLGQNITQYKQDWHEALDLYATCDDTTKAYLDNRGIKTLTGSNPDIPSIPNYSRIIDQYTTAMRALGNAIMHAIALSLGLPETEFDLSMDRSFWVMRLIGYPSLKEGHEGVSCGQHTDYGCLTILNTDSTTGALQVMTKNGEWIDADPVPGALLINIGDMLNIWTNEIYKSTLHRVIHTKSNYRVSVPFFYEPNFNTIVSPLTKCVQESQQPPLYKPIMYGDHLLSKVLNNFDVHEGK